MKKLILFIALMLAGWTLGPASSYAGVSFGVFYSSLGPHGEWIHVDAGVYAWRPVGVAAGWRPYFQGRWIWTDDGWYWASEEPWGWATYHYGRWLYDDYYGWIWVPGYDWAPAWVEWRYGGGCIGWAPLGPYALYSAGWGIHYRRHWVTPVSYWTFLDCRYLDRPSVHRYAYRDRENSRWFGRTRGAGSVGTDGRRAVSRGPDRAYVERAGNVRLERAEVVEVPDRPTERFVRGSAGRGRVEVYRPRIEEGFSGGDVQRPDRVREERRSVDLDVRDADVQGRQVAREQGRDLRRAEEYQPRRVDPLRRGEDPGSGRSGRTEPEGVWRPGQGDDRIQQNRTGRDAVGERDVERRAMEERVPRERGRDLERVPRTSGEPIDRPPRLDRGDRRSGPPERVMRRPESRGDWGRGSGGGGDRGGGAAGQGASRGGGSRGGDGGGGGQRGGSRR